MVVTVIIFIISICSLIAVYNILEMYKSNNINKPDFIPLVLQICIVLLISALIANLVCLFLFGEYLVL